MFNFDDKNEYPTNIILNSDPFNLKKLSGKLKIDLCRIIIEEIEYRKITKKDFAKNVNISNSMITRLTKYQIEKVTIDYLLNIIDKLGTLSPANDKSIQRLKIFK